jgi:hypothetical protein
MNQGSFAGAEHTVRTQCVRLEAFLDEMYVISAWIRLTTCVEAPTDVLSAIPAVRAYVAIALSWESSPYATTRLELGRPKQRSEQTKVLSSGADQRKKSISALKTVSVAHGALRATMRHERVERVGHKVKQSCKMSPEAGSLTFSSLNPYRPCSRPIA